MRLARSVRSACCAIAFAVMLAPAALADEYTKTTHLTFSGPVQVPGMTLPAGTYTFKLADPESGRRTIQIWDKEGGNLLATLLTIPDQLMEPADDPVVLFSEQPAGAPQAVKAWFYPGDRYGQEFVYPKDQAMKIAAANSTSVLAYDSDEAKLDAEALHKAQVGRVDAQGRSTDQAAQSATTRDSASTTASTTASTASTADTADAPASSTAAAANAGTTPNANRSQAGTAVGTTGSQAPASSTTAPSSTAQPSTTAQSAATAQPSTTAPRPAAAQPARPSGSGAAQGQTGTTARAETLPRTASPLGLFGMLSGLSLIGAFGVRQLRRRYAMNR